MVSTSTVESETTRTHLFGNLFWSKLTLSRQLLRQLALSCQSTKQLETPRVSKKSNRDASRNLFLLQAADDSL